MIKTPFFARLLSCIVMFVAITVARADEPAGSKPIDTGPRQSGGELLYNGIRLPDMWPPRLAWQDREPMPVPYLKHPPEVIPIDVGRQLFVDDFLVQQTTLIRTFHKLQYHGPVLTADKPWESGSHEDIFGRRSGHIAAPFSSLLKKSGFVVCERRDQVASAVCENVILNFGKTG